MKTNTKTKMEHRKFHIAIPYCFFLLSWDKIASPYQKAIFYKDFYGYSKRLLDTSRSGSLPQIFFHSTQTLLQPFTKLLNERCIYIFT